MEEMDSVYTNPDNYVNRELSWLEFNYRILNEARDKTIPLFERLKFLSITESNLDGAGGFSKRPGPCQI